jgi:hypothetical protein
VIIPTVPGSPTTMPGTIITPIPAGPSIPPPGTRFPAGSTFVPADVAPSLNSTPRGSLGTPSGGTIIPGTPSTIPGTTTPGTSLPRTPGSTPSFPVDPVPGVTNPSGSGFGGGAFPSGSNYAPATDPLTGAAAPADQSRTTRYRSEVTGPALKPPTTSSPITAPALHPSIQPVPDPAAGQPTRPVNRAPQLLDPRDKTAARQSVQRWAVVPAVWPSPNRTLQAERSPYRRAVEERSLTTPARPAAADASQYDDGGWASSR